MLRPTTFTVFIYKSAWSFGQLTCLFNIITLDADPQIPPLTARLLQTRRFCSGYDTACLTFSTASSLGKLRNCCTGFCWRKWLPTKRSNDLSPNKIWHLASVNGKLHITGRVEELCFSVQVRSQIYATSDADTKYSSLLLFFFSHFHIVFK